MEKRGISFWLKPILALIPFFPPAFGQEEKDCYHLFNVLCFVDGKCVSCSVYGINRNNYNIAVGSILGQDGFQAP